MLVLSSRPNLQPPCSQVEPIGTTFSLAPRGLKERRTTLSDYFIVGGESVLGGWRLKAAAAETVLQAQPMVLKTFVQQVQRIHILMFLHSSALHGSLFIQGL